MAEDSRAPVKLGADADSADRPSHAEPGRAGHVRGRAAPNPPRAEFERGALRQAELQIPRPSAGAFYTQIVERLPRDDTVAGGSLNIHVLEAWGTTLQGAYMRAVIALLFRIYRLEQVAKSVHRRYERPATQNSPA